MTVQTHPHRKKRQMSVLQIKNLNKYFADTKALDDVNLEIEQGCICGLLGPNGAGKTTLLRIINAILSFDSGSVRINGNEASLQTSRLIGYMPEERGLYEKMRVEDQILYFGRLKGGEPARLREVMKEYLELFNLKGQERRLVKELSKGNQQKVQIISTIVHEPDLVIFDEPFSGFDPINGQLLEELLDRLHQRGATIMLSSHNMPAVEEICNYITLINHGRILLSGNIDDIKEANKTDALIATTSRSLHIPMLYDTGLFEEITPTTPLHNRKGFAYSIRKKGSVSNNDVLDAIAMQGEILHFEEALPTLNDIFIKYTLSETTDANDATAQPAPKQNTTSCN